MNFTMAAQDIKIAIVIISGVLMLAFFIWLFYFLRKENKKLTIKTYRDIEAEGIPDLKCPKCNSYMDAGYTLAGKGLLFRKRHEEFKLIALGRLIPNTANLGFSTKENLAWQCQQCQLILIDYRFQIKKGKA